ncbi:Ig-like domain-containing protein [Companilactobacillus halodurans]|uniref:BIG2 domain-containing protein n=1 Tax=Companilactobacillus halodurans TaxID=2584183 RepID=A0A5P0ZWP2_9LACO|nr:Ig-like domain-containing protein [Companilactobacillus halodurans]MQS75421.1 hypothetical protein [Companilactobacillus halodurans]MQS97262.1 hypothetical protein [Companilactobacillus halodurans]
MKKNHKSNKLKLFLLLLIPLILLIASSASSSQKSVQADDEEVVVTPKFKPNNDPVKFLGIWLSNGYGLQPNADSYTTVNSPVTLRTDAGRSVWSVLLGLFDSAHYRWWKSTDGKKWTEVSKSDNGYKKNMTVTPTEVGTVWYQLDTQYYTLLTPLFKTHIYSQVAAVHALPEPVDARSLDVTVDDDYLYNTSDELSNTTFAHAKPTPNNATGELTWSVDDTSLATIDEDGKITANNKGLSGDVKVTATMTNTNSPNISDSVMVHIGGGLDDQTVKSGQTATFTLRGNTGGSSDDEDENSGSVTVDWYKYAPNSDTKVLVSSGQDTSYTTDKNTISDDGSYFQAIVTLKTGKITKTITSNKAKLTVIPAGTPDIQINNSMLNQTYSHEDNTEHELHDVITDDEVTYHDTLTNKSTEGLLKDGFYVLPLKKGTVVNSVKVDDKAISSDQYSIVNQGDNDNLVIDIGDIPVSGNKDIQVSTSATNITESSSFQFTPYVYGTDNDGVVYRQEGTSETINYLSNQIKADVQDIDFGTIHAYGQKGLQYRPSESNAPNNIVDGNDERRDKKKLKVFVSQNTPFTDAYGNTLPVSLRYYENGNYLDVLNNKVPVQQVEQDDKFESISWDKKDGLLLSYDSSIGFKAGKYSTTLTWNFENSL